MFGIYQSSRVSFPLHPVYPVYPVQSNLSNPEAYSEPCQTSKMECFLQKYSMDKSHKAMLLFKTPY